MTVNGATNIMMLLAASSALSQTRTAAGPAWWAPLKQTGLGSSRKASSPVAQGTCPQPPIPDAAFEMIPDGRCRTAVDGNPSDGQVRLAYRITCDAIGTTTVTYLWPASEDQPEACNEAEGVSNVTIPAAYCFTDLPYNPRFGPLFQGSRFACGPSGNATLYGWTAQLPTFNQTNNTVVTRDGARLVTQTAFPASAPFPPTGKTKIATLYVQTPYDADGGLAAGIKALPLIGEGIVKNISNGKLDYPLAVTLQQNRGLYASTGNFDNGNHTKTDAGETATWILKQDWSNGVILTYGNSAMGMMALLAADASPPVPTRASWLSITTNDLREAFYREGLFMSGVFGSIVMPGLIQASRVPRAPLAEHEGNAQGLPFWAPLKFDEFSKVSWPSLHRTSWFDMFQKGGLRTAQGYYEHARCGFGVFGCSCTLLVDALGHAALPRIPDCPLCFPYNLTAQGIVDDMETALGAALFFVFQGATNDLIAAGLNVFWARATRRLPEKIVYVLGSGGNYLTSFDQWPKPTSQTLYLAPDASLVSEQPAASAGYSVTYVYDPSDPAPTFGGWNFRGANPNGEGSVDQAPLRERSDVIHFDGAPLAAPLAICGAISATLAVGSTANDTDFIVRLVDQYPSGERYLVAEGVVRMRWRDKTPTPLPMAAGAVYEVGIDMWSACWIFAAGHRIGIDVTSSSSFAYLPNPNTGLPLEPDGIWPQGGEVYKGKNVTATNSVHLGASAVTLPTVSASDLPPMDPINIPSPESPPAEAELLRMGAEARRVGEHHVRMRRKEPLSFKHIRTVEEDAVPDSVEAVPWEQA